MSQARTANSAACSSTTSRKPPTRWSHPYVHSGSQLWTTHFVPRAVYEYGSVRGMPCPLTMSRPVRRWVSIELSLIGRTPRRKPNSTKVATNSVSSFGARRITGEVWPRPG